MVKMTTPAAPRGRPLTPAENVVLDYRLALEKFVDYRVPGSHEAFTMAHNAIIALVQKKPESLDMARRWSAWIAGFDGPDSDAAVIVQLEHHVRVALGIRHGGGDWGDPASAAGQLHAALLERFKDSKSLPSEADLEDWLGRHAPARARGKLTTVGIVTKIIHRGRLVGARRDEQQTRERVTKALDQKRHPRW